MPRKIFLMACCVFLLAGVQNAFAMHSGLYSKTFTCTLCHPNGPGTVPRRACTECHNNPTGKNYSDMSAPEVAPHSSAVIGSTKYGTWERQCLDCHNPHAVNGFDGEQGVPDKSYVLVDLDVHGATANGIEYTFQISNRVINNPEWSDPSKWASKTSGERGLLFVYNDHGKYYFNKIIRATDDTITIQNGFTHFPLLPGWDNPFHAELIYGQFIRNEVNGTHVNLSSPNAFAFDESGTGNDPTPEGICQVCHTQTDHWRSDGSLADHFSGWRCTICHPHSKGFKVDPPEMELCGE